MVAINDGLDELRLENLMWTLNRFLEKRKNCNIFLIITSRRRQKTVANL